MTRIVDFADGFTSASAPIVNVEEQEDYALSNNASLSNITGLVFDSDSYKAVFFNYEISRIGSVSYKQIGSFMISYNGAWSLSFGNYSGDSIIEETLLNSYSITLSIDSSTGQFKYSSGDQAGHTESKIKLYVARIAE